MLDAITSEGGLDSILDQLNKLNGNTNSSTTTNDGRIHFAVALGYKDSLIDAELERKGLSYPDKLEKLEVD